MSEFEKLINSNGTKVECIRSMGDEDGRHFVAGHTYEIDLKAKGDYFPEWNLTIEPVMFVTNGSESFGFRKERFDRFFKEA